MPNQELAELQAILQKVSGKLKESQSLVHKLETTVCNYRSQLADERTQNIIMKDNLKDLQKELITLQKDKVTVLKELASLKIDKAALN